MCHLLLLFESYHSVSGFSVLYELLLMGVFISQSDSDIRRVYCYALLHIAPSLALSGCLYLMNRVS